MQNVILRRHGSDKRGVRVAFNRVVHWSAALTELQGIRNTLYDTICIILYCTTVYRVYTKGCSLSALTTTERTSTQHNRLITTPLLPLTTDQPKPYITYYCAYKTLRTAISYFYVSDPMPI